MTPRATTPKTCEICSAETRGPDHDFCPTCERRMEMIFHQMGKDGVAVMVPHRVN